MGGVSDDSKACKTRSVNAAIQSAFLCVAWSSRSMFSEPPQHSSQHSSQHSLSPVPILLVFIWALRRENRSCGDGCCCCCGEERRGEPAGEMQSHGVHRGQHALCVGRLQGEKHRLVVPVQVNISAFFKVSMCPMVTLMFWLLCKVACWHNYILPLYQE